MLASVTINAFKPAETPYKKGDGGGLLVQPNGSQIWRVAYRFEGKQKLLSGGHHPQTTLLAARGWRKKMKHQLAPGLDPSVEWQKGAECRCCREGEQFRGSRALMAHD